MPRYYVEEHIPCVMITTKFVDADSEAEAIQMFEDIDSEPEVFGYSYHDYDKVYHRVFIQRDRTNDYQDDV